MALNFKHIKERAMQCIDTHDIDEMKRLQGMIEGECGNSLSLCHTIIENEKVFALVNFRDFDFSLADFYIHSHNTGDGMKSKYFRDMFMTGDGGHFVACICRWLANNSERVEYDTPQLLCLYTALRNERAFLGDGTPKKRHAKSWNITKKQKEVISKVVHNTTIKGKRDKLRRAIDTMTAHNISVPPYKAFNEVFPDVICRSDYDMVIIEKDLSNLKDKPKSKHTKFE